MASRKVFKLVMVLCVMAAAIAQTSRAGTDLKTINTTELHDMVVDNAYSREGARKERFIIIDARTKQEYEEAHIFSAINVPLNAFEKSGHLLPQNKEALLVVYCSGAKGCEVSRKWAKAALLAGYRNIIIYKEGFKVWKDSKMPIAALGTGKQ
jgi:rhodanese-related sulfurtransferase